jgi:serine/threonine-protein kinase
MVGTTISHYKVLEKIGQGGMGEVYRAEDTNLSRDVAIKVLPEQFTQDPQRLARFEREAKLLASLNHPNIAAIYGLEEADGVRFLALELVEGETLAERVAKGPVPVEEALEVCRQIAEGVEAAHEKGVIHRDLKPANVKVTPEGKVKILDFGLAKAFEDEIPAADISQSPTLTEEMTRAGVILGTAAYMSPEQARGKPVDKRADIFAFGAVLYELLTGKRAFEGETVTDVLAKILEGEPNWDALPAGVPSITRFVLTRCLQKDAGKRLQHIDGARILIEEALTGSTTASAIGLTTAEQPGRWRRTMTLGLVALAGLLVGVALWSLISSSPPEQPELNKFVVTPSPQAPLAEILLSEVAISSDGRRIVYVAESKGTRQLYVRFPDEFQPTPIAGTEGTEGHPFLSPDGESVAFFVAGQLKTVSIMGGSPTTLCDIEGGWTGGSWFEDTIVFTTSGDRVGLYRVSAAGGKPEILATPDPGADETGYWGPQILAAGKAVLFGIDGPGPVDSRTAILLLETGKLEIVLDEHNYSSRYLPTGHLVYMTEQGTLMAVQFDLASLEVSGNPVRVLQGIRTYGPADYALSPSGALVYVPDHGYKYRPVWVDRKGTETAVTQEEREYANPRISPDGKRVLFALRTTGAPPAQQSTIWNEIRSVF